MIRHPLPRASGSGIDLRQSSGIDRAVGYLQAGNGRGQQMPPQMQAICRSGPGAKPEPFRMRIMPA